MPYSPPPLSLTTTADAPASTATLTFTSTAGVAAGMSASADGIPAGTTVTATTTTSVTLSDAVSADVPAGSTVAFSGPTLSDVLRQRRGPVGELAASCANLEIPLPLIDIVNECLEYMAAAAPATSGTVYDTTASELPGDDQARLLGVMPEYSTPATPVAANAAVEPTAFNNLKTDFSSCLLPYSQALDVSRSYLRALGSSRFEEMRTFRKCITEFVLDPANEPAGFQDWLWRYPVRVDIAREYLGITPEEYSMLFGGTPVPPCAMPAGRQRARTASRNDRVRRASLRRRQLRPAWRGLRAKAPWGCPRSLPRHCLSYCEFYELWQSGFVAFRNGRTQEGDGRNDGSFPECEPCCPDDLWLQFPERDSSSRAWRTCWCSSGSGARCGTRAADAIRSRSSATSATCCSSSRVARSTPTSSASSPRSRCCARSSGWSSPIRTATCRRARSTPTGRNCWRCGSGPAAAAWPWAVRQLIARVERYAQRHHRCDRRSPEFVKLLVSNLDPISRLAGFDPASATDSWHALPTHTLRFAEVLAKVYASDFSVGELLYLFTAGPHLDGDDPFPLQEANDALDFPLGLPDEEREHALWRLRQDMLAVEVSDEEDEEWPWRRIEAALQKEFGFAASDTLALGQHFFPHVLAQSGQPADPASALFVTPLATDATSASTWNDPPDGPFSYDPSVPQLSARVPLTDRAVIDKLTHAPDLSAAEQQAVQDLYFAPRAMLAGFALLFADFATAQQRLVEEPHEEERFGYFRRQFLLCHRRCAVIAEHLSRHVAAVTGQHVADGHELAALIVRSLAADENKAVSGWESDGGAMPALTWPVPAGRCACGVARPDRHRPPRRLPAGRRDRSSGATPRGPMTRLRDSARPGELPGADRAAQPRGHAFPRRTSSSRACTTAC